MSGAVSFFFNEFSNAPSVLELSVVSIAMAEKMLGNGKVRYLAAYPTDAPSRYP